MHDATLDRTTTGTGTVATITNRKLARYALDDGSAVPSIRQVLRYTAGHGVTVFLDVKALTETGWVRLGSALSDTRAVVRFTGRPGGQTAPSNGFRVSRPSRSSPPGRSSRRTPTGCRWTTRASPKST